MKKYIFAILILFIPCVTHAITMCARNNTLVGSLDPREGASKTSESPTEPLWSAEFSFGTLFGENSCVSEKELENISQNTQSGLLGDDPDGNPRIKCICRITHPVMGTWEVNHTYGDADTCFSGCSNTCTFGMRSYPNARVVMFRSVFQAIEEENE